MGLRDHPLGVVVLAGWRYRAPLAAQGYTTVGALAGLVMGATGIAAVLPLFLGASEETAARNRAHFILWVFVAFKALISAAVAQNICSRARRADRPASARSRARAR